MLREDFSDYDGVEMSEPQPEPRFSGYAIVIVPESVPPEQCKQLREVWGEIFDDQSAIMVDRKVVEDDVQKMLAKVLPVTDDGDRDVCSSCGKLR